MEKNTKWALFFLIIFSFATSSLSEETMGQVAVFNERTSWLDIGTAKAQTSIFIDGVKSIKNIQILNDADIGKWAIANTNDAKLDVIITFGDFPTSLYTPGNIQKDGSVAELFIEGGDMILNSGDYIFYVNQGAGPNGDIALKNITDGNFDMWSDENVNHPSGNGKKYTPSVPESFKAPRCFKMGQVKTDLNWEMEVAFGENGDNADPAIIHNLTNNGRVGIFFQVADITYPRGKFLVEMFDNWLKEKVNVQAVDSQNGLVTAWGIIKHDL